MEENEKVVEYVMTNVYKIKKLLCAKHYIPVFAAPIDELPWPRPSSLQTPY